MKIWNLGYPRIGKKRELKFALESYWAGETTDEQLLQVGKEILSERWTRQHQLGVDSIPVGDFSFYDPMLDMAVLFSAIPERFQKIPEGFERYFAMARGTSEEKGGVRPLEMTKWFNTNYHYLVPEISNKTELEVNTKRLQWELEATRSFPFKHHAVLVGPWTFCKLSRLDKFNLNDCLKKVIPLYKKVFKELDRWGIDWIQLDEPAFGSDLSQEDVRLIQKTYEQLKTKTPKLLISCYFESPDPWLTELCNLPVEGFHFDLVEGRATASWLKTRSFPKEKVLVLGLVNGRNIWATPLSGTHKQLEILKSFYPGAGFWIAPSCSLTHIPITKTLETKLGKDLLSWVSFADEKLEELSLIKRVIQKRDKETILTERDQVTQKRLSSPLVKKPAIQDALMRLEPPMRKRPLAYSKRSKVLQKKLGQPRLPTTTIGSFPQTSELRKVRLDWIQGRASEADYKERIKKEIENCIRLQERLGIDVLVHGECERPDMVEYFAQFLDGFALTQSGWVQSYGSRCTRPPLLYGDVDRKSSSTVEWYKYAQSLTPKPVKGILSGPLTMAEWSYVRDDQSLEKTLLQLAIAIRKEVKDLELAGCSIIQVDEPVFREALPIKRSRWGAYLSMFVDAFKLATGVASEQVQLHTHMCYSDFSEVADSIQKLDVDVISLEHARSSRMAGSGMERQLVDCGIGPGVFDIHSVRTATVAEVEEQILKLLSIIPADRLWINPDCGLKTRNYAEVEKSLAAMVEAAKKIRARFKW